MLARSFGPLDVDLWHMTSPQRWMRKKLGLDGRNSRGAHLGTSSPRYLSGLLTGYGSWGGPVSSLSVVSVSVGE